MPMTPQEIGPVAVNGSGLHYVWVYTSDNDELMFVRIGIKNNIKQASKPLSKANCERAFPGLWTVIENRLVELSLEVDDDL